MMICFESGELVGKYFWTSTLHSFEYIQTTGPYAQNWFNCDPTAPDVENVNLEWAARHCHSISHESGVNGWGNSYDIKSCHKTTPPHVNYAMRCEYPADVAVQCLCHKKKPPEGGARICSKNMHQCNLVFNMWCEMGGKEWGKYNYSDLDYCTKLNVILIDRLEQYAVNMLIMLCDYNALMESVQHVPMMYAQIERKVMNCRSGKTLANTVSMNVPMSAVGRVRGVVQLIKA